MFFIFYISTLWTVQILSLGVFLSLCTHLIFLLCIFISVMVYFHLCVKFDEHMITLIKGFSIMLLSWHNEIL
jgi:hypothetical protein